MKNYLVIGASSGIGRALAIDLAEAGHKVYGTYNENIVESNEHGIDYHALNVNDDTLSLDFLPESLDGIAYCPGNIRLRPFHRIKAAEFMDDYALQLVGSVKVIQAALPRLKKSGNASIVMFSTVAVQAGFNFHSLVGASKGAVEGLVRSLSAELAPAVRVNCVAPSLTDTPLAEALLNSDTKREANAKRHPMQRIGAPADIAAMAAFLLSDKASWITGQVMHVDGGMSVIRQ